MTLHILLMCLRHPFSWRRCLEEEAKKRDPKVQEWRDQRLAALHATKAEGRTLSPDPITAAVRGDYPRRRPLPRAPQRGGD